MRFLGLLFLCVLGLSAHIVWFANNHKGSDPKIEYWPPYCTLAPITIDGCGVVLSLANYFGQYPYYFAYLETGSRARIRVDAYGIRYALPVTPGSLADPDSNAAKAAVAADKAARQASEQTARSAELARREKAWPGDFQRAVKQCFHFIYRGRDADQYEVDIDIELAIDGSLASEPAVVAIRGPSQHVAQYVADSAKRAVIECRPYRLPQELYENWKHIPMTFGLKDLT
ncbi:hypothetical protein [Bradyrhizobium sp. McL0616]|uniref:hypothetical protein n=1 Tax=Bradyrhizobium sp. McL0616 TaxID=3415674 RepID=UPI003CF7F9B1